MTKRFLVMLSCIILTIVALSASAFAADVIDSGTCGESVFWQLQENHVMLISGDGDMYDFEGPLTEWDVKEVFIEEGVTSIGNYAFWGRSGITSVTIPNSVTRIGDHAFGYCTSLTELEIPENVTYIGTAAFTQCSNLRELRFSGDVPEMSEDIFDYGGVTIRYPHDNSTWDNMKYEWGGYYVWKEYYPENYYSSMTDETAPNLTEEIIDRGNCGGDVTWVLAENGTLTISGDGDMYEFDGYGIPWGAYADSIWSVIVEQGVTSIGNFAFSEHNMLNNITIADSVTRIGDGVFFQCERITEIMIPNNVTEIGEYAFYSCDSLNKVTWSNNITNIGDYAFFECENLTEVTMAAGVFEKASPNNIGRLGEYAFASDFGLTEIAIPNGITRIGNSAFEGCDNITDIKMPEKVTEIGNSAFWNCKKLGQIMLSEGLTTIGDYAFWGCNYLKDMTIPQGVTSIGYEAFFGCYRLDEIRIPKSVTKIGDFAFSAITNRTEIRFEGNAPHFRGNNYVDDGMIIYYPMLNPTWSKAKSECSADVNWVPYVAEKAFVYVLVAVAGIVVLGGTAVFAYKRESNVKGKEQQKEVQK